MEESKEPTTSQENEDVEAHGYVDRPAQEDLEANTEEKDVEAHGFVDKPVDMRPVDM
jgi:hypothetical protein